VIDWINENHKEVNGQFKLMGISQRYYGVCSGVCDYSRKTWGTIGFTLPLRLKPGTEYLVAIWALILKNLFRVIATSGYSIPLGHAGSKPATSPIRKSALNPKQKGRYSFLAISKIAAYTETYLN